MAETGVEQRDGAPGQAEALREAVEHWIAQMAGSPAQVFELRLLAGGACQESWALDVTIEGGQHAGLHGLVLRRDQGGVMNPDALSRPHEFRVLQAVHAGGVPVPRPWWATADLLGRAAFLMDRLEGETIGRRLVQDPRFATARERLPEQMAASAAAIHAVDPGATGLDFLPAPPPGLSAAEAAVNRFDAQLQAMDEPHPALELGIRWLRAHLPADADLTLVHGDFRLGNLMVGPEGLRGVLDWEFAHLSDPHEDLAWCTLRAWRFGVDHLRLAGIGHPEPFWAAYERLTGRRVDPRRLFFWEVLGNLAWAVGALAQCRRHLGGAEPSVELASLGRICAEVELELLDLIERAA